MAHYTWAIHLDVVRNNKLFYIRRKKMKNYYADVRISWGTSFEAKNKKDFIVKLKEQFKDDYKIDLTDDEIHNVQLG